MSRSIRNRRIPILSLDSSVKPNNYNVNKTRKDTNYNKNKSKSNNTNILEPKEIILSSTRRNELNLQNSGSKTLLSKSIKPSNSFANENSALTKNSPILKDRINSFNKLNKVSRSVNINNISLNDNKNSNKKRIVENKGDLDKKPLYEIQVLIERCNDNKSQSQKRDLLNNNSEKFNLKTINKLQVHEINSTKKLMKISDFKVNKSKLLQSNIDKSNHKQICKLLPNKKENLKKSDVKNKILKTKNISIENIQELLNKDVEAVPSESVKIVHLKQASKIKLNCNNTESISNKIYKPIRSKKLETESLNKVKKQITNNKFFKNKSNENEMKPIPSFIKNTNQINNIKESRMNSMIDSTESRFTLSPEKQRKSVKPLKKQLRPRTKKNYCELSRLSETSNSNEQTITNTKKFNIKNNKRSVPIYKSIKLSQENFKDIEEIYTFPDESQDNGQKIKQMKKTCKKTTAKQIKKIKTSRILGTLRNQRKDIKKGPINVNFKEQNEKKIVKSIQNHMNPEYLQGAENSTISEVSTIKISSNDTLQDSKKINLTVTPSIPKLITSELKLFGPKNAITSKPTMQYSNMINHSLIRKSMSPITKLVENFDAGSPWRSIDTFSRVQQIVQSTPQINKLPLMRTKKLSAPKINFNKSISSNDTIQVLSNVLSKQNKLEDTKVSIINDHKISPRKFGTVLSNISSFHSKNVQNINKSPIKDNQQSSVTTILQMSFTDNNTTLSTQTESLKTNLLEFPINQEKSYVNKENTITPKKTARKKFNSPSPFRFDKMHSSKRTLNVEPRSKTQTITDEEFKIETTLLHHGDLKPTILRQSNLNNFLNIDQMPEETHISTIHGIFNDVHSTPIKGRKFKKLIIEPTIENAFGFDDSDVHEIPSVNNSSISIINKKHNVKSTKENTTSKVKDKLQISSRILENPAKKLILKSGLKKKPKETIESYINKNINIIEKNDNKTIEKLISGNELQLSNKSVLDSILFSDTFDILCEKKEIKLPKEFPLFIDLQPVHFSEPPRRSYQKRKREVLLDINKNNFVEEKDENNEPQLKKKKVTKINKEERKRINEWVKNINETFEEIDHFDLIVE